MKNHRAKANAEPFLTWNILKQNMGLEFEGKRLSWNSAVYSKIALVFAEQKNGVVDLVLDFHLLTAHLQRSRNKRHSASFLFLGPWGEYI